MGNRRQGILKPARCTMPENAWLVSLMRAVSSAGVLDCGTTPSSCTLLLKLLEATTRAAASCSFW